MNTNIEIFEDTLKNYNIELTNQQLQQFCLYADFLREYNSHTNLVSSNDIEFIWEKHFADSVAFCHYLKNDMAYNIIDIGSGGGFPAIVLAIMLTKSKITAVDSTAKKTLFLQKTAQKLALKNITIINSRAEELAHRKSYREKFDIVTSRAVGNLALISELGLPFLKQQGKFIAYKSVKIEEEIQNAQNAIKLLGGKICEIYDYTLITEEKHTRNLILIDKISQTPDLYPRNYSTIKNKPL